MDEAREAVGVRKLLAIIQDFGSMSTGQFRAKYPDCGTFEGYGYVMRKARAFQRQVKEEA